MQTAIQDGRRSNVPKPAMRFVRRVTKPRLVLRKRGGPVETKEGEDHGKSKTGMRDESGDSKDGSPEQSGDIRKNGTKRKIVTDTEDYSVCSEDNSGSADQSPGSA